MADVNAQSRSILGVVDFFLICAKTIPKANSMVSLTMTLKAN